MPISCIKTSNVLRRSMLQKIYIGTMFLILFVMVLSPILSLVLYDIMNGYINDLCKKKGIDLAETDSGPAVVSLSVLAIVSGLLFFVSFRYYYKLGARRMDYVTPFILFLIAVGSMTGAILMSGSEPGTESESIIDPDIREWCYSPRTGGTVVQGILAAILALVISIFVSYLTTLIGESCEIS